MKCILRTLFVILIVIPAGVNAQTIRFTFTPLLSHDTYHTFGFGSGIDFGGAIGYRFDSTFQVLATVVFSHRTTQFDAIGGDRSLGARIFTMSCSVAYILIGRPDRFTAAATIGGGTMSGATDPMEVSLGAAGSVSIPSRKFNSGFLEAGIRLDMPLSPRVGIVIQPAFRQCTPVASASGEAAIAGGLRVSLF